jgi:mannose-6-phosphate isomerase-like protein (cupin superfamily)
MTLSNKNTKLTINDIGGYIAKEDERYTVKDNPHLKNLMLSSTFLFANKETSGHTHDGQEEIYFFVKGHGEMTLDDDRFPVEEGDVVVIEDGVFHQVHNTGHLGLYFVCVFDGGRNH